MNPITGKRFVKTWLADQLFPYAWATYKGIEQELGVGLIRPMVIYRLSNDPAQLAAWRRRCQSADYMPYVALDFKAEPRLLKLLPVLAAGVAIRGGAKLEPDALLNSLRAFFGRTRRLVRQQVTPTDLPPDQPAIYCEGHYAALNALTARLPLVPARGHYLVCDIPGLGLDFVLQGHTNIIPQADGLYRVGSTYQWQFDNHKPEPEPVALLTKQLADTLGLPFVVQDVRAGVRPTTPDNKPILGPLTKAENRYVFNGLGTKGFSLAPYFASMLCDFLLSGSPIMPDVDARRFG